MNEFTVYNKSSEDMSEIRNNLVDLIVTDPPFNIGVVFGRYIDQMPHYQYCFTKQKTIAECYRVLKNTGQVIVLAADSTFSSGKYVPLAFLWQTLCLKAGFKLFKRDIIFNNTETYVQLPEIQWQPYYMTSFPASTHSNCLQMLHFSKEPRAWTKGEIYYINFHPNEFHHCPFPNEFIDLLNHEAIRFVPKNGSVVDPFAGTARLGLEVIQKNLNYVGYEIDEGLVASARQQYKRLIKK